MQQNSAHQFDPDPLNYGLSTNINMNVNQLNFPNVPMMQLANPVPCNFITTYQALDQHLKIAQAVSL